MGTLRIILVTSFHDDPVIAALEKACTDLFGEPLGAKALVQAIGLDASIEKDDAEKAITDVDKLVEVGWYIMRTATPTGITQQAVTICDIDSDSGLVHAATISDFLAARLRPYVVPMSDISNRLS